MDNKPRLLQFGATGRTGQEILTQCLKKDYHVTAFVRSPGKIKTQNGNLEVINGDVFDYNDVLTAVKNKDVVISALGSKFGKEPISFKTSELIINAMKVHNVKRFIVMSAYGSRKTDNGIFAKWLRMVVLKDLDDKAKMEDLLNQSGLDFTVVRPVALTNGKRTGSYKTGKDIKKKGVISHDIT